MTEWLAGPDGRHDENRPAYLATVPQAQRGTVAGMLDGTIQPPTSMAAAKAVLAEP
jgi:hypothetical protein